MWAAQYYRFEQPRRWINSGGLGTMGVGLPYAMGIKLAKPDAEVVCITGEGSIQMCIQELSTCLQYKTPVKIISLNNRYLGMVRQWQQIDYGGRYSHSYMDALPDFVKLAEAYGHVGIRIDKPTEVEPALREDARARRTAPCSSMSAPTRPRTSGRWCRRARASPRCCWAPKTSEEPTMKHIIAFLLENEPGALSRVVALFSARGYNIETLTVAPTEDPSLSRMTIVTTGSDEVIEQITKHLNRLIEVVKVVDLTEGAYTERELMLIKVRAVGKERDEMKRMAEIFRGRIIDVTEKSYTVELTGDADKLDAFMQAIDRASSSRRCAPARAASAAASASFASIEPLNSTEKRHEGLLRQGRRPESGQGQERHDHRLRLAGPRACPEPQRQRRSRHGRVCARAGRRGPRRKPPSSRSPKSARPSRRPTSS